MDLMVKMELLSDAIFGSGKSIAGEEDIGVQLDADGFPYLKGSTLKGLFREELINFLLWNGKRENDIYKEVSELLGEEGANTYVNDRKIVFSDFVIAPNVKAALLQEVCSSIEIKNIFLYPRTFTALEDGMSKEESLRKAQCIKSGFSFYGTVKICDKDKGLIRDVLLLLKWVGSMKNRGFGSVKITVSGVNNG